MSTQDRILDGMRNLVLTTATLPSMDTVAKSVGLSKGGLLHHFPSRAALVDALVERTILEVDDAMGRAAAKGEAARTWLRLSVPDAGELELYRAMAVALKALGSGEGTLPAIVAQSLARWDALLVAELGDEALAITVRLVGDGLFMNALSGTHLSHQAVELVTVRLLSART